MGYGRNVGNRNLRGQTTASGRLRQLQGGVLEQPVFPSLPTKSKSCFWWDFVLQGGKDTGGQAMAVLGAAC